MSSKLLRFLGWGAYAGLVLAALLVSTYFAFNLFVRSGVTAVPGMVGLPLDEAEALVRDQGLRLRWKEEEDRYDESLPPEHVVRQSPPAGSFVKRGSEIHVVRSLGQELVEVPDLSGKALQAAQVTLSAAGLALGKTAAVYSSSGLPGTVVEQSPPPGRKVGRASEVELYLSLQDRTETYLMPDLIYRRLAEVERFFSNRNFRMGSVKFEVYEGIAPGVILRQFPLPGHPLRKQDVISLVVTTTEAAGPES